MVLPVGGAVTQVCPYLLKTQHYPPLNVEVDLYVDPLLRGEVNKTLLEIKMQTIRIARLRRDAILPTRKHPADAGLDVYAVETVEIAPHNFAIVPTGVTVEIPAGYVGLLKPKGRSDHLLGAGVVDAGYQGEILIKVANLTDQILIFKNGDAVGQLLILPVLTPAVEEVDAGEIHGKKSSRGAGGGIVTQHTGQ